MTEELTPLYEMVFGDGKDWSQLAIVTAASVERAEAIIREYFPKATTIEARSSSLPYILVSYW